MATVEHALAYARLGWFVLPLKPGGKAPLAGQGLKHATRDEKTIQRWFKGCPDAGIGIALAPSGLAAVDIDPRNGGDLDLRDRMPPTLTAATGGGGLHLVYRVPPGVVLRSSLGAGIDVKHHGYIAVEPSVHPSGKRYSWLDFEPAEGENPQLADAPAELMASDTRPAIHGPAQAAETITPEQLADLRGALHALAADDRQTWVENGQRLVRLGAVGRELWLAWSRTSDKFDAADADRVWASLNGTRTGYKAIFASAQGKGWVNPAARPDGGSDPDTARRERQRKLAPACVDDADPTDEMPLMLKNIESAGRLGADFAEPVAAARCIVATLYTKAGRRLLHYWQGEFHFWARCHYSIMPLADVRQLLYSVGPALSKKPVKKRSVDDVLDALKAEANLSHRRVPAVPAWIGRRSGDPADPDPRAVIPVHNGLVCVESGRLLPATPRLFVPYALPFDYAPDAAAPVAWLGFLASIWRDDQESIDALQEWLGYLLTADTSRQKALMIVGPRRSGKGTIGRVIVQLLGDRNVASPTLASLGNNFGLEPLIGKTAALMSDARLGARADIAAVAENLLRLTGEDTISVDQKFKAAYTAKLLVRVVVLTNELPVFRDAASALPSRFILLRTARSFYGHEDHDLDGKLAAELPGILVWALAGLRRLRQRGRFVQPAAGAAQLQMMEELASPISTFVRDVCIVEPGGQVPIAKLYEAWRDWCKEHGRDQPGTEQTFGRDIAAAVPTAGHSRPRINGARVRMYDGLRLRAPDDRVEDDDDEA